MIRLLAILGLIFGTVLRLAAQSSTTFAYQGHLSDRAQPANGFYQLQFRLADAATGGNYLGPTLNFPPVLVSNGVFTISLDFGATVFDGSARWLDISVRTNGFSNFTQLTPRQAIAATPYAVFSANAATAATAASATTAGSATSVSGPVAASQLTGVLSLSQLPSVVVTNGSSGLISSGDLVVTNTFSAGLILTSALAHVTGLPVPEPIVARWAPDPGLGYNIWYDFQDCAALAAHTTSNYLAAVATEWATNGMLAAGWNWFTIDDSWEASQRVNGHLAEDLTRFPGGIKGLVDYMHSLGFKVMIYTSFPYGTCCGHPGTGVDDVENDVTYFAQCGFDGIKVDSCGAAGFAPDSYELEEVGTRLFCSAIYRTGRPMTLWMNYPNLPPYPQYLRYQDNLFSVWSYSASEFPSGLQIFTNAEVVLDYHTNFMAPGHFTFGGTIPVWASPLDRTNLMALLALEQCTIPVGMPWSSSDIMVLTNSEVIALAKDPGVLPPSRVWDNGTLGAWVKPLGSVASGTNVLALINRSSTVANIGISWASIGLHMAMTVRDMWEHKTLGNYSTSFSNSIPAQSVRLYKLWPQDTRQPYTGTNVIGTTTLVIRDGLIIDIH